MKAMQDFHNTLFIESETRMPVKNHFAALTHLSPQQVNSLVEFTPWYLWTSESAK